jgi:S-DNA-T family DNA segregation ATPase FtsK/SpoIIIE
MLRDPLFDRAVRVVLESKRGSVSLLQRRLTIGYSRASRLIEQMAEAGIVGEYKGSQAREVNMTVDEWDVLQKHVQADMQSGYQADQEEEYASEDMPDADDEDGVPALTDDHDIRD